jgi:hypothetical protein
MKQDITCRPQRYTTFLKTQSTTHPVNINPTTPHILHIYMLTQYLQNTHNHTEKRYHEHKIAIKDNMY